MYHLFRQVFNSVINNDGAKGSAIRAVGAPWVRIANTQLTFGTYGIHAMDSSLLISNCTVSAFIFKCFFRARR